MITIAVTTAAAAAAAAGAALAFERKQMASRLEKAKAEQQAALDRAQAEAERIEAEKIEAARAKAARQRAELTEEIAARSSSLDQQEIHLTARIETLEQKAETFESRESDLQSFFDDFKTRREALSTLRDEVEGSERRIDETLERLAGTSRQMISQQISEEMVQRARLLGRKKMREQEDHVAAVAEQEARRLIDVAAQRYGMPLPTERLISTVTLPSDARSRERLLADDRAVLKALTESTAVDFVPTDDPEVLLMQAPDPFTREIGRLAFTRLTKQKQIDDQRIRQLAERVDGELHAVVRKAGKRAARILKLKQIHPEISELVGKLLYRTSYTQNQWQHAIETSFLCGMMAEEMGLPVYEARRAALLHDIGKVLWAETEAVGSHAVSGAAYARERGEDPDICHAIAAHHDDEKPSTPLAHLVAAADALSGARPGARREMLESYTQRVDDLERISSDFPGVEKAYVIQGGRELRLIVDHRKIDDLAAAHLSSEVAHRIEDECVYPGQIKVTVIRETKYSYTAR